jgi:hypothetical protein
MDLFKDLAVSGNVKGKKKVERAVVLIGPVDTRIIYGVGGWIESDLDAGLSTDEAGPVGSAPKDQGRGLWIWEGIPRAIRSGGFEVDEGFEPDYSGGTWRRPTTEEIAKIVAGDFTFFGPAHLGEES